MKKTLPAHTETKKTKAWLLPETFAYGPECLRIPHPTRKKAVELKRGTYLRVSQSFWRKDFPFIREVHFCIDLANDEKGAENWREVGGEWSTTDPQVEKQEKLEGSFRFELAHRHSLRDLFHLWRVDEDGKPFCDDHQYANQDCWISEQEVILPGGIEHG